MPAESASSMLHKQMILNFTPTIVTVTR
jgi:hypothetical protein